MGRRWSRKHKNQEAANKKSAKERGGQPQGAKKKAPYKTTVAGNAKMETYYALQGLHNARLNDIGEFVACSSNAQKEEERLRWMTSLRTMLPASFRIGTDVECHLRERLETQLEDLVGTDMDIVMDPAGGRRGNAMKNADDSRLVKKTIAPAKRIPFIPHAYQLNLDRRTIRRNPSLEKFHEWLTAQTSSGFITRQETVSMIPPVVLQVEPHHAVLDMCAAPGSKTSQILEIVSSCAKEGDTEPRGCVVANDSDSKRAYMLVHQLRRINSPVALVTSCDAQFFPLFKGAGEGMFDRVLCDVPCSGDGTARKNPGIFRNWSALGSLALHPLQLGIALNGARLTKVGGYMCYSTCAMNPVENEAVVAELLRAADGALELVDPREKMEGLVARPGWTSWRVLHENKSRREQKNFKKKNNAKMQARRKEWQEKNKEGDDDQNKVATKDTNDAEATKEDDEKKVAAKHTTGVETGDTGAMKEDKDKDDKNDDEELDPNRFTCDPPPSWDDATLLERARQQGLEEYKSFQDVPEEWQRKVRKTCFPPTAEEAEQFGLEKCLRCLPHDMDTGGFFVALLKKVAPMSARAKREALELAKEFQPEMVEGNDADEPDKKRAKTQDTVDVASDDGDEAVKDTDMTGDDSEMVSDTQVGDTTDADNADMVSESEPIQDEKKPAAKKGKNRRGRGKPHGKDDMEPLSPDIWEPMVEYYGLSESFPREQYMRKACSDAKSLYFVGKPVKNLLDRGIQKRITMINTGLKSFARNNRECKVVYRVAQEGIHFLAPHMTKRKFSASAQDFRNCINPGAIRLETFSDEFAAAVRELDSGSFVVCLKGFEKDVFQKMFLVMWKCRGDSVNCLVAKVEMEGMKSKLQAITASEEAKGEEKMEETVNSN